MVRHLIFFILFLPIITYAQSWDFSPPEKLTANVNTEYEEAFPLVSPDGQTLYFSRVLYPKNHGGKFSGSDVWISSFDPAKKIWGDAINPKALYNGSGNNAVVGIHSNGEILYLMNTHANRKAHGVYFTKKIGKSWTKPELIPIEGIEPLGFLSFYVSPDFEVILISMKASDSRGEEDLYVSVKNNAGQWSKPKNLGPGINTTGFEISPFLSQDKKRLYFSSNGHKGFGDADIFYCDRLYNSWDTWTAPRNLGEKLNSKNFDAYFSIYGDSIAYFSSNRNSKYSDIYRVKVVPGNEVLAFGQRYLNTEEINRLIGEKVSRRISFEGNTVEISAPQKELIFYIANRIVKENDINVQLTVVEENDAKLSQDRLNAVAQQLRVSGIENARLLITNSSRSKKESKTKGAIEISFYK